MTIHEFDPEIYPVKLWIVVDEDDSLCDMFKYKVNNKPIELDDEDESDWIASTSNMVVKNDTKKYGVIISLNNYREIEPKYMAHEACHFTNYVYNYIGAKEVDLGGEQHAYFLDWTVGCIDSVVKTIKSNNKMTTKKTPKMPKKGTGKKC